VLFYLPANNTTGAGVYLNTAGQGASTYYYNDYQRIEGQTYNKTLALADVPEAVVLTPVPTSIQYDGEYHYPSFNVSPTEETVIWYSTEEQSELGAPTPPAFINAGITSVWAIATNPEYATSEAVSATVEITKRPLTIKVNDEEGELGTPVFPTKYTITSGTLVTGQALTVTYSGVQTPPGISAGTIEEYVITDSSGDDVTANYDVTLVPGTLTVNEPPAAPEPVILTASAVNLTYDGAAHGIDILSNITSASINYSTDAFSDSWTGTPPTRKDVGATTVWAIGSAAGFVTSAAVSATIKIALRPITIAAVSTEKDYDGSPLVPDQYTLGGTLASGQTLSVSYGGIQTEVGTSAATISHYTIRDAQNADVTSNYQVALVPGTLTVNAKVPVNNRNIVAGTDNFRFVNATSHFFKSGKDTYKITGDYYDALLSVPYSDGAVYSGGVLTTWRQVAIDAMNRTWGGSCFGMSATLALTKAGRLDTGFFQSNAKVLHDLSMPKDSVVSTNLINYYQLMQSTRTTNITLQHSAAESENLEYVVKSMKESAHPVIISIMIYNDEAHTSSAGGHAILGYDLTEDAQNYIIKIWDPNYSPEYSYTYTNTLTIKKDYSSAEFENFYPYVFVRSAHTVEGNQYDYQNIQDYLKGKSANLNTASLSSGKVLPLAASAEETISRLTTNYEDFTISSGDKSAVVEAGRKVSGDIDIGDAEYLNEIDAPLRLQFSVPKLGSGKSYTVTPTAGSDHSSYETSLFLDDGNKSGFYTRIVSDKIGDFIFGADGSTKADCASDTQITIAATLATDDKEDKSLYTTTVTGTGTIEIKPDENQNLQVKAEDSDDIQITASGDYNAVTFESVDAQEGVSILEALQSNSVQLIDKDLNVLATKEIGYVVSFHSLGGTPIEAITNIPENTKISKPADPTLEGYTFAGWYTDADYKAKFDFGTPISKDYTLYAKWDLYVPPTDPSDDPKDPPNDPPAAPDLQKSPGVDTPEDSAIAKPVKGKLVIPKASLPKVKKSKTTGSTSKNTSGTKAKTTPKLKAGKKISITVKKIKGVKITYQWYAGNKPIKKATKATFKTTKKQIGKKLSVKVTYRMAGYDPVVKTLKINKKIVK
jgi:uncharacterized repeat protein (TIGR02543 family)